MNSWYKQIGKHQVIVTCSLRDCETLLSPRMFVKWSNMQAALDEAITIISSGDCSCLDADKILAKHGLLEDAP